MKTIRSRSKAEKTFLSVSVDLLRGYLHPISQFYRFGEEDIIFEMDVLVQVSFKRFQLLIEQPVRRAAIGG